MCTRPRTVVSTTYNAPKWKKMTQTRIASGDSQRSGFTFVSMIIAGGLAWMAACRGCSDQITQVSVHLL